MHIWGAYAPRVLAMAPSPSRTFVFTVAWEFGYGEAP